MLDQLPGLSFHQTRHALTILYHDYRDVHDELEGVLRNLSIYESQVIEGGGGKSKITQNIEGPLSGLGWKKKNFPVKTIVDGEERESETHEIDHFRAVEGRPGIALEIEWNNKDPFFDRDLGNFQRLHAFRVIGLGILLTRGPSLQQALRGVFERYYCAHVDLVDKEVRAVKEVAHQTRYMAMSENARSMAIARRKFQSKYGEATTHWTKLMDRVERNMGDPCPMLFLGIESARLRSDPR